MQTTGGATPLMYACQQCMEKEVSEILRKQPHAVKDRDRTLKTPLHYCAENPNTSCAEAILKAAPELVNAQDENGYCTLHLAVIAGNKPLIKLLISKGADVNIHDKEGHSSVHWAIVSSEKEALEMIVRAGADPSTPDIHGGYPLHYAVQICGSTCDHFWNFEDSVRVVEMLLGFGVDVNVKDKDGRQPILWAASAGSADAVIHLVSGGACVEAADKDGLTALHCAASRGHTKTLETLITLCGAHVDVIDGNGCSALFYSVTLGHADATELLLRLGADPNRQDRKGRTPAHCGAAKGQLETLRILQKHGGNLWMRNVKGDIPLHEAVASGRKDLVIWLLSQNSDAINLANNDGRCPLHIASMYNNTEMVKVLLDSKSLVNPIMRTSKGILMTPLNVALYKGHRSCGKYLQLHGGVPFSKVSKVEPASGFTLRVSPSDDMMILEPSKENLSSQSKISKSRSSTDIQGNHEVVKTESADKKKVYRRRKKKKTSTAVNAQDTDSEDSTHDAKSPGNGRSNDENGEKLKTRRVHLDTVTVEKESLRKRAEVHSETAQTEVSEVTKVTKSLQRNKSFNETKNVSDLSPQDFPPQMQAINQLDVVIMEPDIDVSKSESENIEIKTPESVAEVVNKENTADVHIQQQQGVGLSQQSEISKKEKNDDIEVKTTSEGLPKNEEMEAKSTKSDVKVEKENIPTTGEKPGKVHREKKQNGSNGKSDFGDKSKSSDEGSTKKSVRPHKSDGSSVKKESKKSNGSSETVDKHKKSVNSKVSKKSSETKTTTNEEVDKTAPLETKTEAKEPEFKIIEAVKEPEVTALDVKTESELKPQELKTETEVKSPEVKPEAEVKSPEVKAEAEVNSPEVKTEPEVNSLEVKTESEVKSKEVTTEYQATTIEPNTESEGTAKELITEPETGNSETVEEKEKTTEPESVLQAAPNTEANNSEQKESNPITEGVASEMQNSAEEIKKEINHMIVTTEVDNPPEGKNVVEIEKPQQHEKVEDDSVEIISALDKTDNLNTIGGTESEPVIVAEETVSHVIGKRSADVGQTPNENPEVEITTAEHQESAVQKEGDRPSENNGLNEFARMATSQLDFGSDKGQTQDNSIKEDAPDKENEIEESNERKAEQRQFKTPRVSRLCRRHREFKDDMNEISVTQLVQNTIRKYHMERGIFYQLLELKRYQIKSGRANEQVLVKRLADEYERSRVFLGMKPYSGLYKFREFEKFLYDQLKLLNTRRSFIIPDVKSYDDIDALSGFLKKSRYKIINEIPQPEMVCTCITQRCHHSACAYTSVPCSAYITDLRRHHRHHKPKRECFFPRIEQPQTETQKYSERPATLELIQGSEKHVITLPQHSPAKGKRYYVTFTIKGAPGLKGDDFGDEAQDFLKHRHSKSV